MKTFKIEQNIEIYYNGICYFKVIEDYVKAESEKDAKKMAEFHKSRVVANPTDFTISEIPNKSRDILTKVYGDYPSEIEEFIDMEPYFEGERIGPYIASFEKFMENNNYFPMTD